MKRTPSVIQGHSLFGWKLPSSPVGNSLTLVAGSNRRFENTIEVVIPAETEGRRPESPGAEGAFGHSGDPGKAGMTVFNIAPPPVPSFNN